ncbi:serine hydrolase [Streptomyces sp. NBC_00873]|uniref:hypothetical protein n=1 Tax=unclassified Streptomyces TaxID=2593676 RepID=UPI00386C2605|nr:serine hydrolase [Streptomyces sp. NBC_00873]WTA43910.1 serine hydrolase [Streptomyces sp. NBC_00842]
MLSTLPLLAVLMRDQCRCDQLIEGGSQPKFRTTPLAAPLRPATLLTGCATNSTSGPAESHTVASAAPAANSFNQLEQRFGARLGVSVLDAETGREVTYRADERFAHASTFKALVALRDLPPQPSGKAYSRDSSRHWSSGSPNPSGDLSLDRT